MVSEGSIEYEYRDAKHEYEKKPEQSDPCANWLWLITSGCESRLSNC